MHLVALLLFWSCCIWHGLPSVWAAAGHPSILSLIRRDKLIWKRMPLSLTHTGISSVEKWRCSKRFSLLLLGMDEVGGQQSGTMTSESGSHSRCPWQRWITRQGKIQQLKPWRTGRIAKKCQYNDTLCSSPLSPKKAQIFRDWPRNLAVS